MDHVGCDEARPVLGGVVGVGGQPGCDVGHAAGSSSTATLEAVSSYAVRRDLDRGGVVSRVVELPMTDLASDITVTRRALDEFDRPAVLVGHSYGGAVTTGAGTHPHVAHLLYLAAYQLAEGESVGRTLPDLGVPPTRLGTPCASPTTARW